MKAGYGSMVQLLLILNVQMLTKAPFRPNVDKSLFIADEVFDDLAI